MTGLKKIKLEAVVLLKGFFLCPLTGTFFYFVLLHGESKFLSYTGKVKRLMMLIIFLQHTAKTGISSSQFEGLTESGSSFIALVLISKSVFKFQDFYCLCH